MTKTCTPAEACCSWWCRTSLTVRILAGLFFGTLLGLFFGEKISVLESLAHAYIGLMQMTVLPFLMIALIFGLGQLSPNRARLLAKYGGLTLLVLWSLTLLIVGLIPLTFPAYESALFFSTSLLHPHEPLSFVELYIPANPFRSMANNMVPAVTLFSAALGIALMGVDEKQRFLEPLHALMKAMGRVMSFVVEITPIGVIPIAAVAAGTLSPQDLERLEVYFVAFFVAALLIGILLFLLVSVVTPFRFREVAKASSDAMLTAFVTSNVFVVLPMITEQCQKLSAMHGFEGNGADAVPEVVVPIAFNFPTAGKLLTLMFVPFAAWMAGSPLDTQSYPGLMITGLFSYFAKAQVALPFLMDLMEVPHDLFQLYIPTTLLNGKIDSAVGAISLFAFSSITAAAMAGRLKIGIAGVVRFLVAAISAGAGLLLVTAWLMAGLMNTSYREDEVIKSMHLSRTPPPTAVYKDTNAVDDFPKNDMEVLERIKARGTIRVGYDSSRLPFTFFNRDGELVGFDVELVDQMASDLGVKLEFLPVQIDSFDQQLLAGEVDIVMSVPYTHHWVKRLRLSSPYVNATVGFLVRDPKRHDFADLESIRKQDSLVIGIPGQADLWEDYLRKIMGSTPFTMVTLKGWQQYFDGSHEEIDAVLGFAEEATAWSLLHPDYSGVVPRDLIIQRPLAIAMAPDADELSVFVNEWVVLQQARGNIRNAYDYWILGKGAEIRQPRWCIGRDVLGWFK